MGFRNLNRSSSAAAGGGGGTVTSVTAGDASVVVGGTATDPTVKAALASAAPPQIADAAATGTSTDVARKDHTHKALIRYQIYFGRVTNIAASQSNVPLTAPETYSSCVPKAGRICGWTFMSVSNGLTTNPTSGSPLIISVIRTSAAGVADAPVQIASIPVGTVSMGSMTLLNPINLSAGDSVVAVVTTDGSWTGTAVDPGIKLIFEEA